MTNWFVDTMLVELNTGTFRLPKEYDMVLQLEYGEYRNIPTLKKRIDEILVHIID